MRGSKIFANKRPFQESPLGEHIYFPIRTTARLNHPFPSCLSRLFQSEAKSKALKISFVHMNQICMSIKLIFIWNALHGASLWNRDEKQLANRLFTPCSTMGCWDNTETIQSTPVRGLLEQDANLINFWQTHEPGHKYWLLSLRVAAIPIPQPQHLSTNNLT